jgi:uncharacterized protein (DUF2147 family)
MPSLAAQFMVVSLLLAACEQKPASPPTRSVSATDTNAAATPVVKPEFARLVGKWQRPDGGYVIEIKNVDPIGKLQVAYFNPNPINVSRAAAYQKDGGVKVFVELRDINYPGSTYDLAYDPQSDQLFGQYFQAALQQTFDVTFARLKEQ